MKRALIAALACAAIAIATTGCPGGASCKAYSAGGFGGQNCGGRAGWLWNGISCIYGRECVCTGEDCQRAYASQDACETAHIQCSKTGGGGRGY